MKLVLAVERHGTPLGVYVCSAKPSEHHVAEPVLAAIKVPRDGRGRPRSCRAWSCRLLRPLFGLQKGGIDKGLVPVDLAALVQLAQQLPPGFLPDAQFLPAPQSPPAGYAARILLGHVSPACTGT